MKKILLTLAVLALVIYAASSGVAVTVSSSGPAAYILNLTSADPELIFTGPGDYRPDLSVFLDSEYTNNFLFDMGNVSADPASKMDKTLTIDGVEYTRYGPSVKHTVNIYGPGKLALAGNGDWQGTTTIAYNWSDDTAASQFVESGDGYVMLKTDEALPTWNPLTLLPPGSQDAYPHSINEGYRSVLDLNGFTQSLENLLNSHDEYPYIHGPSAQGIVYLEGDRAGSKKLLDVDIFTPWVSADFALDSRDVLLSDDAFWPQGQGGTLVIRSSKNGDGAEKNELGKIWGYGTVKLTNNLQSHASTVFSMTTRTLGTGPRLLAADDDDSAASMDANCDFLSLTGFQFGAGTEFTSQVTLRPDDMNDDLQTDVRARFLSGGFASSSTLDLSAMQYTTAVLSPDRFIVDTDGDHAYWGGVIYPSRSAANLYNDLSSGFVRGKPEANFIKTGFGTQVLSAKTLTNGAVFKADEIKSADLYYASSTLTTPPMGHIVAEGRSLVDTTYYDGELKFWLDGDVRFGDITERPLFLAGAGTYGFAASGDHTIDVDMHMYYYGGAGLTQYWPSVSPVKSTWAGNDNFSIVYTYGAASGRSLPFDNTNLHVYDGVTLANAIFGMTSGDNSGVIDQTVAAYPGSFYAWQPDNSAYDASFLDPEVQMLAPNHTSSVTPNGKGLVWASIHPDAGSLTIDEGATVKLKPWSWSALGSLNGKGILDMESGTSNPEAGSLLTVPTATFLRIERSGTLEVDLRDQYHRAYLWLGIDRGDKTWNNRFFMLGKDFKSSVKKISVTRGASLAVAGFNEVELNSSVAFYGSTVAGIEPATYVVNVQKGTGAVSASDGEISAKSSRLAVKDGNQFYFGDPVDLADAAEPNVKLEFRGSARAGDVFLILRGQNASDGANRFVYDATSFILYSIPSELGRNLYARALIDMDAPVVTGVGQDGKFTWNLMEASSKMSLGTYTDPATGIIEYEYRGDALPEGMSFGGMVNGSPDVTGTSAGYFNIKKKVMKPFKGYVYARNLYGWSDGKQFEMTTTAPAASRPVPSAPVADPSMISLLGDGAPASLQAGDLISVSCRIDPAVYDLTSLVLYSTPAILSYEWDDQANGIFTITGTMTNNYLSWYFEAERLDGSGTYRSSTGTISLAYSQNQGGGDGDSGAGEDGEGGGSSCNTGMPALFLLAALPFLRSRRSR